VIHRGGPIPGGRQVRRSAVCRGLAGCTGADRAVLHAGGGSESRIGEADRAKGEQNEEGREGTGGAKPGDGCGSGFKTKSGPDQRSG